MKTYTLLNDYFLSTTIKVSGKMRVVEFSGGSRHTGTNGFFSTDNRELQKAIERDSGYGKVFVCISDSQTEKSEQPDAGEENSGKNVNVIAGGTPAGGDETANNSNGENGDKDSTIQKRIVKNPYYELLPDKETATYVEEVTSKNTAIAWLQANRGANFEATIAADVKKEAADKYNILFVNWV